MMELHSSVGYASTIALVALATLTHGRAGRRLASHDLGGAPLSLAFGAIAAFAMLTARGPEPGVIFDLRVVPIVLAGAFLGGRALMACVVLAIAARFSIGGEGWPAGTAAVLIAALVGSLWRDWVPMPGRRRAVHFAALGVASSAPFASGTMLRLDLAATFFVNVVPVLAAVHLVAVPLLAALLDREQRGLALTRRRRARASLDAATGLLTEVAFAARARRVAR